MQINFVIITNLEIRNNAQDNHLLCVMRIVLKERNYCIHFTLEEIMLINANYRHPLSRTSITAIYCCSGSANLKTLIITPSYGMQFINSGNDVNY